MRTKTTDAPAGRFDGRRLRALREAAGLTQHALAVAAGKSAAQVAELEAGRNRDPRYSTVLALAGALGVTAEAFRGG